MISIVIPTKNEEYYLPKLLQSIKKQDVKDIEVLVADAGSNDKTLSIAKRFGAIIVEGGHPGKGRNIGAKHAKNNVIFFHDADVILPKGFLGKNLAEFKKRGLDVATTFVIPDSKRIDDKTIHHMWNIVYAAFQKVWPVAAGFHIIVKKDWFNKVKGFDESVLIGEDIDLIKKLCKAGAKFGVLKSVPVIVSVRRMERETRPGFIWKYLVLFIYQLAKGKIKKEVVEYKLGDHKPEGK